MIPDERFDKAINKNDAIDKSKTEEEKYLVRNLSIF